MKLTVITEDDRFSEVEFSEDSVVSDVKIVLQIEFGIPAVNQELFANNKVMHDNKLIKDYCHDNDMIKLVKKESNSMRGFNNNPQMMNNASSIANALSNMFTGDSFQQSILQKYITQARDFKQQMRNQPPYMLDQLRHSKPELANLLQNGSDEDLAKYLQKSVKHKLVYFYNKSLILQFIKGLRQNLKKIKGIARINKYHNKCHIKQEELEKDPFNPINQRKIEEIINQRQIDENLELAQEHIPEVFDCVINNHQIQAFVDTGAESTIMSQACAERCGLMRLVDKRFSGMASGVGTGKIIGRIHKYAIQILDQRFECSFTVLESINLDFLLGLDNMKRFQCCVNLKDNTLNFWLGNTELKVPFLHEKDIKKTVNIEQEQKIFDEETKRAQEASSSFMQPQQPIQQQQPMQPQQLMQPSNQQPSQFPQGQGVQIGGGNAGGLREQDINQLVQNLGVTRDQAIGALRAANGSLELAGSILAMRKF